ncbi:MAG TPA: PilX N-terminal domain-containing pilus assembly protein [bacterium]|nr:PilX N-terminal domain-containing pilus assembly protein [bacterium]
MRNERGAALVTVLILVVVLSAIGVAMVNAELTEITIAYNQGDATAARSAAEAGIARGIYELGNNAAWPGVTTAIGDGQYQVTVTASGTVRVIQSIGTRGGGRRQLQAAVKALPPFALYAVLTSTTATLGSANPGVTIRNALPSLSAGAVQANNRLGAGTAITANTAGATLVGAVTANGTITGIACGTWPWTCTQASGVLPVPRLDMDSAAATSYKSRAQSVVDPVDGLNLYFHGGDATSRCMSGGVYSFDASHTQQCWDQYVNDRIGVIGTNIAGPVFFAEFNSGESTRYRVRVPPPQPNRTIDCAGYSGLVETLCIRAAPATDNTGAVFYPNSALNQVTGTIVAFRRGGGTTVVGDVALENLSLRAAGSGVCGDYCHVSLKGDPAFLAARQFLITSSGAAAAQRKVTIRGVVYTLGGSDNPDGSNNLQGASAPGINIQHGADLVALVIEGILMSNGDIILQKSAVNGGTVAVEYDSAATDLLPTTFLNAAATRTILVISWSSGD